MSEQFDLIVIGSGAASSVGASCRKEGWKVALIESGPFGGTCALRGCDPKKVLVDAARALRHVRRMKGKGIDPGEARIDWKELIGFKRTFTDDIPERTVEKYRELGIVPYSGRASFVDRTTVEVNGDRLTAPAILVATGAEPVSLDMPGSDLLTSSAEFMERDSLPDRVLFVGGGFISFEFAHLARQVGASVTILNMDDRPLAGFDQDLVGKLVESSRDEGIDIRLSMKVVSLERKGGAIHVTAEGKDGSEETFVTDLAVHGAGRVPAVADLNVEAAGITLEKGGIAVDEFLRSTTNPHIWAAGDCTANAGLPLTPVASQHAGIVTHNLLHGLSRRFNGAAIPSVAFTMPSIASVGYSVKEAEKSGRNIEVRHEETTEWFSSRHINESATAFKTIVDRDRGTIIGAHILASHAHQTINLFALAMRSGLKADQLTDVMYTYPSGSYDTLSMV